MPFAKLMMCLGAPGLMEKKSRIREFKSLSIKKSFIWLLMSYLILLLGFCLKSKNYLGLTKMERM